MKRFLVLLSFLFCGFAFADTETINWYVDDTVYATNTCTTGGDIILPTTPTKYGYTFQGWNTYIPIEYLESTGTQYIDTGFNPFDLNSTRFIVTSQFSSGQDSAWMVNGISSRNGTGFFFGITDDTSRNSKFVYHDGTDRITTVSAPIRYNKYTYDYNGVSHYFKVKQNETELVNVSVNNTAILNKPTIVLFGSNNAEDNGSPRIMNQKIYNAKIYYNTELVHDFIPVLDYNNTPCMYDKVTNQYFYNQGTGDFIAGPVIGQ